MPVQPRREPSSKIGSGYNADQSKAVYETTRKERDALLAKFAPKNPRNPIAEGSPRGKSTVKNSLRMRQKGLTAKVGQAFDADASRKSYEEVAKESKKIINVRRPKNPNNPLSEENLAAKIESPKNSLRLRNQKSLSNKVGVGYDMNAANKSFAQTREEAIGIRKKVKPVKPRNPLGDEGKDSKHATSKNSLRMRQKGLSAKIGQKYDGKGFIQSYQDSRQSYSKIVSRARPKERQNPLSEAGLAMTNSKVPPKKELSAKVGVGFNAEKSRESFKSTMEIAADIRARVKPANPRNPLTD
mmetsp:Transcript_113/g.135  ORF Transcript_113/g.135 Transcript_113/m.135 type:complete len:299 (-) Transcript_113:781-1677(-)|eukprot:CAMPEP_0184490668 /NCGR_PEP_ID=MMETSP0113_2-20130426/18512_1 /TAXON_ID=91329 /ORGANISM="Norrisiella sphaerica, Strain BC52" /LENGTH=298 /DNA_ID=CAMNT_0026874661 /DNA_START=148 /DNA_END=1044 /DNA_ORIENTATION=+